MGKRLLFTLFAILFCSTTFGQVSHWETSVPSDCNTTMTIITTIQFDGIEQNNPQLELGVFNGDKCRAAAFTEDFGTGKYVAWIDVKGKSGESYTFKVYDHETGEEKTNYVLVEDGNELSDTELSYVTNAVYGEIDNPYAINFKKPNHYIPENSGDDLSMSITAIVKIDGVEQKNANLELGAFINGVVKGSVKTDFTYSIDGAEERNYARMNISGSTNGDVVSFKLFDHSTNKELEFTEVNTIVFEDYGNIGSIAYPLEVNFITAPYVAQVGENKYLSFDAALEAAEDGDNIELLKSIDLGTTTAVIEESINITLGSFSITGTVELANKGATITGAENGVTEVITNVADYKVVYEDGKYKLVKKLSGEIAYRAYVTDTESVEAVSVDLSNVYASSSLKVELYNVKNAVEELLVTTTYAKTNFPIDADSFTCFMVLSGTPDEYWNTTINAEELTIENLPKVIKLYVDGELVDTYNNALGAGTNVDETEKYKALDCVYDYKVAKVGDKVYWNINNAIANWTAGSTLTLLEDVTLSDVITLKSTEHHILNLDTYTMTAAEGKNAIEITCNAQSSETYALTVKANSENPGGIIAGNKSCIYYSKSDETKDRPIITIENGVFNGGYSINIYSSNRGTNCPTVKIANGTFNGNVNIAHGKLITTGGIFNGWINCTGDVTAYRLISGGTFKQWQFMTAGPSNGEQKFTVGKTKNVFDCGVYVDDNGYLVVGGDVITEAGTTFEAYTTNYSGWSNYLQYSSAATNGLYYTSAEEALADNNKTNGSVNIYTDELDLTNLNYKGTLVITKPLTVTFPEGTTPAWTVASGEDGHQVGYTESVKNGVVTRVYTLFIPVAKVGETSYATLQEAIDATTSENTTVKVLQDITLDQTATIAVSKEVVLDLNGKTINAGWENESAGKHIYAFTNNGTLTIKDSSTEADGTINARGNYNYGTLTLVNGTINAIDHNGGYGIQNLEGSTFTMNGGLIATTNENGDDPGDGYDATTVRVESGAVFVMNGGEINNINNYTFAIDNHGTTTIKENAGEVKSVHTAVANYGTMTISAGTFICNGLEGVTAHALWADAGITTINGGTFDGKNNYNGFNVCASAGATVYITGGNFLPVHSGSLYGEGTIAVSGGTFFDAVPEARCAEGYIPTTNADGTYGVKPGSYVAQVGEVKYETLEAAIEAATDECTIDLLADVEVSDPLLFSFNSAFDKINVTFNGNGKTIKAVGTAWNENTWLADIAWNVTLNNVTFDGNNTGCKGVQFYTSTSTLNNITVKNISADKWGITDYAIHANASELTVIGSLTFEGCKHGMFMVDLGNNTGKEASVVSIDNNATVNGVKVILNHKDASLEAPASAADYVSMGNVPGYTMVYENGVYKLVAIEVQTITLEERWNWVSHYVVGNTDSDILAQLQNGLGAYGVQIKNQNDFTDYGTDSQGNTGWFGTLYTTSVKEMYKVNTSLAIDQTLQVELSGVLVDPAQHPITLVENWNYIGYPLNEGVSVGTVFANVAKDGDYVKSQDAFAEYYGGTWHGNLKTMTPGEGYMYRNISIENVDVTKTLVYSYPNAKEATEANITSENNYWVPASSQYAGNMTMVAMLDVKGGDYEVAAFVGGEVRGSSRPVYIESLDAYMFFLTIHGEEVEEMTFKVYDLATGEEYDLNNRMNYSNDAVVGSIGNPYVLSRGTTGIGESALTEVNIYPNPTTTGREVNLGSVCDTVEVFNALGVKVAEYQNVDTVDALETAGIYVIRITNDGNVQNCRLVVK